MSTVYREPGKIIRDILLSELELTPGQVMFTNQKIEIPTVGLYIALSYLGPSEVLARNSELAEDENGVVSELQSATMQHTIEIQMMAYNDPAGGNEARERFVEIQMALSSIFAQQIQEQYQMQIARHVTPFSDTSFLEEMEMMTRYTTQVKTTSVKRKQKTTNEYYSDFSRAVPPQLVVNA